MSDRKRYIPDIECEEPCRQMYPLLSLNNMFILIILWRVVTITAGPESSPKQAFLGSSCGSKITCFGQLIRPKPAVDVKSLSQRQAIWLLLLRLACVVALERLNRLFINKTIRSSNGHSPSEAAWPHSPTRSE